MVNKLNIDTFQKYINTFYIEFKLYILYNIYSSLYYILLVN